MNNFPRLPLLAIIQLLFLSLVANVAHGQKTCDCEQGSLYQPLNISDEQKAFTFHAACISSFMGQQYVIFCISNNTSKKVHVFAETIGTVLGGKEVNLGKIDDYIEPNKSLRTGWTGNLSHVIVSEKIAVHGKITGISKMRVWVEFPEDIALEKERLENEKIEKDRADKERDEKERQLSELKLKQEERRKSIDQVHRQQMLDKVNSIHARQEQRSQQIWNVHGSIVGLLGQMQQNNTKRYVQNLIDRRAKAVRKLQNEIDQALVEELHECSPCHGDGVVECGRCNNNPYETCYLCKGSGRILSFGSSITCGTCYGQGRIVCSKCRGVGSEICGSCYGKGFEVVYSPDAHQGTESDALNETEGKPFKRDVGEKSTMPCSNYFSNPKFLRASAYGESEDQRDAKIFAMESNSKEMQLGLVYLSNKISEKYFQNLTLPDEQTKWEFENASRQVISTVLSESKLICERLTRNDQGVYHSYVATELTSARLLKEFLKQLSMKEKLKPVFEEERFKATFANELASLE